MKKIFLLVAFILVSYFTYSQAVMTFEKTSHDFGAIQYNGDGTYVFEYTNTGNMPLIILDVASSCGCTTPIYTKEPLKAGEKGLITVKYDTTREGTFSKSITIKSTAANSPIELKISGKVELMQVKSDTKTLNKE